MMMMEDTRRQVAMGDMVHDMLIDRPPSPARMEYRSVISLLSVKKSKGCLQKIKIAEKETLVHSHLSPSPPSLNGTRGIGIQKIVH